MTCVNTVAYPAYFSKKNIALKKRTTNNHVENKQGFLQDKRETVITQWFTMFYIRMWRLNGQLLRAFDG
jgi:hypothetical protein